MWLLALSESRFFPISWSTSGPRAQASLLESKVQRTGAGGRCQELRAGGAEVACRLGLVGRQALARVYFLHSFTTFFLSYPVLCKGDGSNGDGGGGGCARWWELSCSSKVPEVKGRPAKWKLPATPSFQAQLWQEMMLSLLRTQYRRTSGLSGLAPGFSFTYSALPEPVLAGPSFHPHSESGLGWTVSL